MAFLDLLPSNNDAGLLTEHRPRYQPLVVIALALAAGIALDHSGWIAAEATGFSAAWFVAVALVSAWWLVWRGGHLAISAWLLLAAIVSSGAAWHDLYWNFFPRDDIGRYAGAEPQPACARATVLTAPEILPAPRPTPLRAIPGGERSRAEVLVSGIRDGTKWLSAGGRCQLLVDGHLLDVHAGDELNIFAQLRRPLPPLNPGQFDFAAAARADGRLASLMAGSPDCVTMVQAGTTWSRRRLLGAIRASGKQILDRYVGREQSPLAAAILLGARDDLSDEELQPFFLTGTIHVIVVSGLNVGILAMGLYATAWLGWLPRRVALAMIMAVVVAYTLVANAEPPVVRSAVLVVLICLGAWTGRRGVAFNALAAAAIFVLVINPAELFQTGTQLSFLCVAVLVWVNERFESQSQLEVDPLDRLIADARPWPLRAAHWALRWTLWLMVTTGVVWLATLPLVLQRFHLVTPIALMISPVVWAVVLVGMWAGFLTLVGGWLIPGLAPVAGWICSVSLSWLVDVVNWAEAVPGGHFWSPGPANWWVLGFYLGFVAIMLWGWSLASPRWQVALACGWILIGLAPPLARPWLRGDELRCSFIAVGHGTCVVLETPDRKTLLYDAGALGSPEFATEAVAGFLWQRGIARIDGIIISHADVDHFNAVPGLLERFNVGTVYVSPMMFDWFGATGPSAAPEVLRQAINEAGVPIREIWAGDRLHIGDDDGNGGDGDITLEVIHPPREGVVGRDNANSITLTVEHAGRRLLLPGDLETPGLEDVMAELPHDCDVLMAPHHGSRRSDPPGFAAWSTPEWVVISGGADTEPVVLRTYEAEGASVLNTGEVGAVEFRLAKDRVEAMPYRPELAR